jgi:tetratricopeptide (TPR) repeat protein
MSKESDTSPASASYFALQEAQVLLEARRPRAAAALFDSIARWRVPGEQSGYIARHRIWSLTHAATAYAAAGDTAQLASLADTLRRLGPYSSLGRDRRLHHYVHGLLLVARGDDAAAIPALRASIVSPTTGYTRASYELARALLRQGRPADAVAVLQPTFRGGLEASNLYITRSELHALLAQAWDAAGRADSAATHYSALVAAWRRADPHLRDQVMAARQRLAALSAR